MTPARLRGLSVVAALVMFGVGGIAGQVARRSALVSLRDIAWGFERVTVTYTGGGTPLAVLALLVVLVALGGCAWFGARFAARRTFADPAGARSWTVTAAAVWAMAVAGAVIGWLTTTSGGAFEATRVADFLRDGGSAVDASITSGERDEVRPSGGGGTVLTAPLTLEFTLDGAACSLVVDDPIVGDGNSITLIPFCPDAPPTTGT